MNPQLVVSPGDLERAAHAIKSAGNPLALVGRLAGLGQSEMRAGIPVWAWALVAFGVGTYFGARHLDEVREKLGLR